MKLDSRMDLEPYISFHISTISFHFAKKKFNFISMQVDYLENEKKNYELNKIPAADIFDNVKLFRHKTGVCSSGRHSAK